MRTKFIFIAVAVVGFLAIKIELPFGRTGFYVRDVTKRDEAKTTAPWGLFRTGALYVTAKGVLDGSGRLHIYANHGREYSTIDLKEGRIDARFGGAEEWVGDLRVVYEPVSAKSGDLRVELLCGRNPK
jgi:hypothetical protein